jgi:hypothetical protein
MDDRDGRDALRLLQVNADLMSTQTFIERMVEDFKVKEAETAWTTLERIPGESLDPTPCEDPSMWRVRASHASSSAALAAQHPDIAWSGVQSGRLT